MSVKPNLAKRTTKRSSAGLQRLSCTPWRLGSLSSPGSVESGRSDSALYSSESFGRPTAGSRAGFRCGIKLAGVGIRSRLQRELRLYRLRGETANGSPPQFLIMGGRHAVVNAGQRISTQSRAARMHGSLSDRDSAKICRRVRLLGRGRAGELKRANIEGRPFRTRHTVEVGADSGVDSGVDCRAAGDEPQVQRSGVRKLRVGVHVAGEELREDTAAKEQVVRSGDIRRIRGGSEVRLTGQQKEDVVFHRYGDGAIGSGGHPSGVQTPARAAVVQSVVGDLNCGTEARKRASVSAPQDSDAGIVGKLSSGVRAQSGAVDDVVVSLDLALGGVHGGEVDPIAAGVVDQVVMNREIELVEARARPVGAGVELQGAAAAAVGDDGVPADLDMVRVGGEIHAVIKLLIRRSQVVDTRIVDIVAEKLNEQSRVAVSAGGGAVAIPAGNIIPDDAPILCANHLYRAVAGPKRQPSDDPPGPGPSRNRWRIDRPLRSCIRAKRHGRARVGDNRLGQARSPATTQVEDSAKVVDGRGVDAVHEVERIARSQGVFAFCRGFKWRGESSGIGVAARRRDEID